MLGMNGGFAQVDVTQVTQMRRAYQPEVFVYCATTVNGGDRAEAGTLREFGRPPCPDRERGPEFVTAQQNESGRFDGERRRDAFEELGPLGLGRASAGGAALVFVAQAFQPVLSKWRPQRRSPPETNQVLVGPCAALRDRD